MDTVKDQILDRKATCRLHRCYIMSLILIMSCWTAGVNWSLTTGQTLYPEQYCIFLKTFSGDDISRFFLKFLEDGHDPTQSREGDTPPCFPWDSFNKFRSLL
jgi:hypothetical protein